MADPITALTAIGLAGNVTQFISQAIKVITKGREAYASLSGSIEENATVEETANELRESSRKISESLHICDQDSVESSTSNDELGLVKIAQSCEAIAKTLVDRLETFKVEPGRLKRLRSFAQAAKSIWKKEEVEKLQATLLGYQQQLDTRIIVLLRIRFEHLNSENVVRHEALYGRAIETLGALKDFRSQQQRIDLKLETIEGLVSSQKEQDQVRHATSVPAPAIPVVINDNTTTLHVASAQGDVKTLRRILSKKPTDVELRDEDGQTAVHVAASVGSVKSLKCLARCDATLDSLDYHGRTPLHCAVMSNQMEAVQTLLVLGVKDSKEDDDDNLAFHYANHPYIKWMLTHGHDLEAREPSTHLTALMRQSMLGLEDVVQFLIKSGADIESKDPEGRTALMLAGSCGSWKSVYILCDNNALVEVQDDHGDTALTLAASKGMTKVVQVLLKWKASIRHRNDSDGHTAVMRAVHNRHWNTARILVQAGSSLETYDRHGFHMLGACAKANKIETVDWLLHAGANPDTRNHGSWTALHEVACVGHDRVLDLLLKWGACTELPIRGAMEPPLQLAAKHNHVYQVRRLLESGANPGHINAGGWSIVEEASDRGNAAILKMLLERNAYLDTHDNEDFTPLHKACIYGHLECASILLDHGASTSSRNKWFKTPLTEAVIHNQLPLVELMLSHDPDINSVDIDAETALQIAAQLGHEECLKLLLDHGASTNNRNNDGWTALAEACHFGRHEMVHALLTAGADTELSGRREEYRLHGRGDEWGWTPLMRAVYQGHTETVKLMVRGGANLNAVTSVGETVFDIATDRQSSDSLEYLQSYHRVELPAA